MTKSLRVMSAVALAGAFLLPPFATPAAAGSAEAAEKRARIDKNARETLDELMKDSDKAGRLYAGAFGYAVFSDTKVSLGITGGGGVGVAVEKGSGERTYMRMATVGLNLGLGAQKYQVVFLFEDEPTFHNFVDKGWKAEGSANAVAGTAGANAGANFTNGMAVYQITEGGLMLQADISGTKYWKADRLNER